jgi:hypothetical protein
MDLLDKEVQHETSPDRRHLGGRGRLLRRMVWKVVMVHHDDKGVCDMCGPRRGEGEDHADFAYSVGLHDRYGLPEVHCPALSTDDPPLTLGFEALGETVNSIAVRMIAGELTAGSTLEFTAGDGHSTSLLRFTLGLPGAPAAVSALAADPEAMVIPVTWALVERECACARRAS